MKKGSKGLIALLLLLAACGGAVGKPNVGGESHFLRHCFEGCGDLECVSDLCTRSCLVDQNSCGDLSPRASCTNASVEPGAVAVCDLDCSDDAGCSVLGDGFECQGGFCRSTTPPTPGGEAGAPSSGGSSSGGSASAGTSATGGTSSPPDICALPFEAGPCKAAVSVYTAVDGVCQPATYGGCEGNANRFNTLEECMARCEGRPGTQPCPEGRVPKKICLECGPAGGCSVLDTVCAQACDAQTPCTGLGLTCFEGICQAYGCE